MAPPHALRLVGARPAPARGRRGGLRGLRRRGLVPGRPGQLLQAAVPAQAGARAGPRLLPEAEGVPEGARPVPLPRDLQDTDGEEEVQAVRLRVRLRGPEGARHRGGAVRAQGSD